MKDYIVRATAAENQIRAFAATTRELTEAARVCHNTSPVATAALGRLLTAGSMMKTMLKEDRDVLTLQIKCEGPINGITVTAGAEPDAREGEDPCVQVKGYVHQPLVMLPASSKGKLDVGGAVGRGTLTVIKDMGLKEPYAGKIQLVSGEIAEDLTYYFASSEQVPSSVALGVLMNKDNTVRRAGGFILQLMPFAEEGVIDSLEKKIAEISSITSLLDQDLSPERILENILGEFGVQFLGRTNAVFSCSCSKDKVKKAVAGVGKKELEEMIAEDKPIEVNCHFCNTNYNFTIEELEGILNGKW